MSTTEVKPKLKITEMKTYLCPECNARFIVNVKKDINKIYYTHPAENITGNFCDMNGTSFVEVKNIKEVEMI